MSKTDKQLALELEGTNPAYWEAAGFDDATIVRVLGSLSSSTRDCALGAMSDPALARALGAMSSSTLTRVRGALSGSTLDYVQSILDLINPIKNPYTTLLAQIKKKGCKLDMGDWHTCNTTHCLAGWVVTLAKDGAKLEKLVGTSMAATLILKRSRPEAPLPYFSAPNEAAMAFIEARVKEEKAAA